MFILYAIVAGLALGLVLGGRWQALADIRFRWAPLILVGFLAQVVLFSEFVSERVGAAGPALYVVSTLAVGAAVVRNARLPGMPLIILGAVSNVAAILANGGFMPAAPGALASLGKTAPTIYSNSAIVAQPALELLTDRFALPRWLPLANVFSVGDVLIGVGLLALLVATMVGVRPGGLPRQPSG
ncbi:MAG TPA: DUF5317 family protein [Candidatus Deferrimicrobium sp.]|nr:DUF5317 family protein [Candidatus Deferrimicrobium sp.]